MVLSLGIAGWMIAEQCMSDVAPNGQASGTA